MRRITAGGTSTVSSAAVLGVAVLMLSTTALAAPQRAADEPSAAARALAGQDAVTHHYAAVQRAGMLTAKAKAAAKLAARLAAKKKARAKAERRARAARHHAAQVAAERRAAASRASRTAARPGSNRALGRQLAAARGWGDGQFGCLDRLWTAESGWSTTARNSSGAYGIPQAKPGSKMASAGSDWASSARTQILWGLSYIASRYGTPCGAYASFQSKGWY